MSNFEKVKELLVEKLGVSEDKVTLESEIVKDLGADSLDLVEMLFSLEENFGITVIAQTVPVDVFEEQELVGNKTCDLYSHSGNYICQLTTKGFFKDLNSLTGLNLSASYWGQNMQEEYNILGKLYFVEGDFETRNEDRVPVITFNEKV